MYVHPGPRDRFAKMVPGCKVSQRCISKASGALNRAQNHIQYSDSSMLVKQPNPIQLELNSSERALTLPLPTTHFTFVPHCKVLKWKKSLGIHSLSVSSAQRRRSPTLSLKWVQNGSVALLLLLLSSSEADYHKPAASPLWDAFAGGQFFSHGDLGSGPDRVTSARRSIVIEIEWEWITFLMHVWLTLPLNVCVAYWWCCGKQWSCTNERTAKKQPVHFSKQYFPIQT